MADHIRETFKWHLRGASRPPRCFQRITGTYVRASFYLKREEATCDFDIPKMIHATFYVMVVNDALELGIMSKDMARALKSALAGLWWLIFESWLMINEHALWSVQLRRQANQEVDLSSGDTPPLSSDD